MKKNKNYFTSDLLDFSKLKHGFFNRNGGVSSGFCESLNTSFRINDLKENVLKNREIVAKTLGFDSIFTMQQVHESDVLIVDKNTYPDQKADAMVSNQNNLLLGVQTADCVPVLLFDYVNNVIGCIHAGWRSAVKGIVNNTIKKMLELGAKENFIHAAIGPCIQQISFEVGLEVKKLASNDVFFKNSTKDEHFLFDLSGYVFNCLIVSGIEKIELLNINTYTNEDFFSFRRSTHLQKLPCGGQISVIGMQL